MSPKQPPSLAAWMLGRLVPGKLNEALEGDLLEELRLGRSSMWYWRQVLCIVAIAWRREIFDHRMAFLFAALWSMLAPAWLALSHAKNFHNLVATARQFGWPWSAICPVLLQLSPLLAFLWTGLLLSFTWNTKITKNFGLRPFRQGFVLSTQIFLPVWLVSAALKGLVPPDFRLTALFVCLPFFVTTLCAIWGPSHERNIHQGLFAK